VIRRSGRITTHIELATLPDQNTRLAQNRVAGDVAESWTQSASATRDALADRAVLPRPFHHATYRLPFQPGQVWRVNQEGASEYSHSGWFAWDFTNVYAPADGLRLLATAPGTMVSIEPALPTAPGSPAPLSSHAIYYETAYDEHVQHEHLRPNLQRVAVGGAVVSTSHVIAQAGWSARRLQNDAGLLQRTDTLQQRCRASWTAWFSSSRMCQDSARSTTAHTKSRSLTGAPRSSARPMDSAWPRSTSMRHVCGSTRAGQVMVERTLYRPSGGTSPTVVGTWCARPSRSCSTRSCRDASAPAHTSAVTIAST